MYSVGIHAFRVEQSRNQLRAFLQLEKLESVMLDIFNLADPLEDWWKRQVSYWRMDAEMRIFLLNLNSWSF